MSSIEANRPRLQALFSKACEATSAIDLSEKAISAFWEIEERRRREQWSEDDEEEEGEEGRSNKEEEEEHDIKQIAMVLDDFSMEDFDSEATRRLLGKESLQRKQEATKAYDAFVAEFEACVKNDSLDLIKGLHDKMRTKLPVELRDMIYSFLRFRDRRGFTSPMEHGPCYIAEPQYDRNFQCNYDGDIEEMEYTRALEVFENGSSEFLKPGGWLLNPDFVGQDMAHELAESLYSVKDFGLNTYYVGELLFSDRPGTGFQPYKFIRGKMNIYIRTTCSNGASERAWETTENEVVFLNGLYTQLSHLTRLTNKSRVAINITLSTSAGLRTSYEEGERRFYNIMESIRAPIYDLIHMGFNISVIHSRHSNYRTTRISEGPTNYFRMGKAEWEAEKADHGTDWMPSRNFILREELHDTTRGGETERRLREALEHRWGHTSSIDSY